MREAMIPNAELVTVAKDPFGLFLEVMQLGPENWPHAVALLGFFAMCCYLLRTALMIELVQATWVHVAVCVLTLLPGIVMAIVLGWAAYWYPERAWFNLLCAVLVYVAWWAGGAMTRLVRPDTEGGDVGWLAMGALITFPVGVIAALVT
jgi:hypothetical protein